MCVFNFFLSPPYRVLPARWRFSLGYYKCSGDAKAKMQSMMAQGSAGLNVMKAFGRSSAFNSAMSGLLGTFSGSTPAPTGPEIVV
jgi:hypothetical protein